MLPPDKHAPEESVPVASQRTGDVRLRFFDSHFHVIDPRFPLSPNQGYVPPFFTITDYQDATTNFNVIGGAVVAASFQGFDQRYLVAALHALGPRFVGVTQLAPSVTDDEILELDAIGVRAVRFNLYRGGFTSLPDLERVAQRVFELAGWHVELSIDARDLPGLTPRLLPLPHVSIDHLGLSAEGLPYLLKLVEQGASVKATGFGRCDFPIEEGLRSIYAANPNALHFGTDLPSTRAPRPFAETDVALVLEALGESAGQRVLYENAYRLYKLA